MRRGPGAITSAARSSPSSVGLRRATGRAIGRSIATSKSYQNACLFAMLTLHVIRASASVTSRTARPRRSKPKMRNRAAWRATAPVASLNPARGRGTAPGTSGPK
jgi:hypothetical protein